MYIDLYCFTSPIYYWLQSDNISEACQDWIVACVPWHAIKKCK